MVLAYLRRTSGLRPTQITCLVARWDENRLATVPLAKRYRAPPGADYGTGMTSASSSCMMIMLTSVETEGLPVSMMKWAVSRYSGSRAM